ncbi:MAG: DUF1572 family protein [Acidobacteria bacterium]|nr:DUF1572 family protein [Acidobacteriota bacterium]
MSIIEPLSKIYDRDLAKLREEVEMYPNEADLWMKHGDLSNSGGTLAIHLCGSFRHFVGAVLGNSGYVRDRDAEFAMRDVPRSEIFAAIDETRQVVAATLPQLTADDLEGNYPIEVFGHPMTTEYFLIHLATHLSYHLGQINYHRRTVSLA